MRVIATPECRLHRWRGVAILVFATGALTAFLAPRPAQAMNARVQYLSSTSVYLDAGRTAGLTEGTVVHVERQGRVIAELVVDYVAANSAACSVRSSTEAIQAGDTCVFLPTAEVPAAPGTNVPPGTTSRDEPGFWSRLSAMDGSVSTWYIAGSDEQGSYANPAARVDVRWRGSEREEFAVRARADRPVLAPIATDPFSTVRTRDVRIYEASARYRARGEGLEIEAGRHYPNQLEALGAIDGGAIRWRPLAALRLGAAGGRNTNLQVAGLESPGARAGAFVEFSDPRSQGGRRWRTTVAALRLDDADVTRQQFVQWRTDAVLGQHLRLFENLEVNVNPGWTHSLGAPRYETARYGLTAQAGVSRQIDLTAGYDFSRDPLLPEQRSLATPMIRQQWRTAHGAVRLQLLPQWSVRLGTTARLPTGAERTLFTWDGSVIGSRLGNSKWMLMAHGSRYDTRFGAGTLIDGSASWQASRSLRLDVGGGSTRTQTSALAVSASTAASSGWLRAGFDVQAGYGMWIGAAGEWRTAAAGRELMLELGQQF